MLARSLWSDLTSTASAIDLTLKGIRYGLSRLEPHRSFEAAFSASTVFFGFIFWLCRLLRLRSSADASRILKSLDRVDRFFARQ